MVLIDTDVMEEAHKISLNQWAAEVLAKAS